MKTSEDAVVEEGAEDARGSIVLQFFSVQLEIYLSIFVNIFCIYLYAARNIFVCIHASCSWKYIDRVKFETQTTM